VAKYCLVAFDTRHIKKYVFATDKLKEIRGASSLLDYLNRQVMKEVGQAKGAAFSAEQVFANGGAALFLVEGKKEAAEQFGRLVQQKYRRETFDGSSVAFAVQEVPDYIEDVWGDERMQEPLDLLYACLEMKSNLEEDIFELPSHPLMLTCYSCGARYAETSDASESGDVGSRDRRYCWTCQQKREEDGTVKRGIDQITDAIVAHRKKGSQGEVALPDTKEVRHSFAWGELLCKLPKNYDFRGNPERPSDFNELRGIAGGKDYFAVIHADGNGMGQAMQDQHSLRARKAKAKLIDGAVYQALRAAVSKHLPVVEHNSASMFPFDLLLVGGDDILIVTPADVALDVALTLAQEFYQQTGKQHSLSVSVVLAPIKYPFGLLHNLAEEALSFAKREGARRMEGAAKKQTPEYGETVLNFMVVTGSTSQSFEKVFNSLHKTHERVGGDAKEVAFYATLRPYTVEELTYLLEIIREGKEQALGRTKLHQVREAVLKMNLTSSVMESLALLRNWGPKQRELILKQVYTLGGRYQQHYQDQSHPEALFPRVTFPWFADGPDAYRTSLLDFVELYDFVRPKGGSNAHEG
jgi:hypothetical protein